MGYQAPQTGLELPPTQDEKPDDTILILCDYLVWGFSFRSKQWVQYHVDNLIDVDFNSRSFERLVLREDYKTILKAMVAQHFTQGQNRFRDLVAGKGQGLNILLHGLIASNQVSAYGLRLSRSTRSRQNTHCRVHRRPLRKTLVLSNFW